MASLKYTVIKTVILWKVRVSNSDGDEIFRVRPDGCWVQPASYTICTGSLQGGKATRAWRWPPALHLVPRLKKE